MDSMKRTEATIGHHQSKVVSNNLAVDSNKVSSSNNNKNNNQSLSGSSTSIQSSEIKETNFEYDDNEWDVGIGDLIIDLDADIEKSNQQQSAAVTSHHQSQGQQQQHQGGHQSSTQAASLGLSSGNSSSSSSSNSSNSSSLQQHSSDSSSSSHSHSSAGDKLSNNKPQQEAAGADPLAIPKILAQKSVTKLEQIYSSNSSSSGSSSSTGSGKVHSFSSNESGSSLAINKGHQKLSTAPKSVDTQATTATLTTGSGTKMSSTSNTSSSKSAAKVSVDHQATLDKGLKMKIKRTKPGTKSSEAKHEIVKAEQNGATGIDDSSNSSTGSKKHSQAQPVIPAPVATPQQSNKRGSSSHRRDKQKEKTSSHSQRDKSDHGSGQNENCSFDSQQNGASSKNDSMNTSLSSLSQRLSSSSSSSTSGPGSNFSAVSGTSANAPGPPKDGKVPPLIIHSSSQISSATTNTQTNTQQQQQQQQQTPNTSQQQSIPNISSLNQSATSNTTASGGAAIFKGGSGGSTSGSSSSSSSSSSSTTMASTSAADLDKTAVTATASGSKSGCSPPPSKKVKCDPKDMVDVCVGTSVGTITEPDCLGPCEPGTSVTLEGIVWHETEGGVLVVNVTWRGKTYVGTLLDCTRHDWAPPRLCDSPTEELDARIPKGRAKRGRSAALQPTNDLSNFTETRSSVHSKLRNGGSKGRGGRTTTGTSTSTTATTTTVSASSSSTTNSTPSPSPTAFLPPRPEKRKSKDESPSPINGNNNSSSSNNGGQILSGSGTGSGSSSGSNGSGGTQSLVNPVTGLNVQISAKKCKTTSPCAVSPVLIDCPETECNKKFTHTTALRYHQSAKHGSVSSMDEDSSQAPESPQRLNPPTTPSPGPPSQPPTPTVTVATNLSAPQTPTKPPPDLPLTGLPPPQVVLPLQPQQQLPQPPLPPSQQQVPSTPTLAPEVPAPSPISAVPSPLGSVVGGSITTGVAGQPIAAGFGPPDRPPSDQPLPITPVRPEPKNFSTAKSGSVLRYHGGHPNTMEHSSDNLQTSQMQLGGSSSSSCSGSGGNNSSNVVVGSFASGAGGPQQRDTTATQPTNLTALSVSLNAAPIPMRPIANLLGPMHQSHLTDLSPTQNPALIKGPGSIGKPKKSRKSPGPGDFDSSMNREDVQSPAYSDISDDSTPVVDGDSSDKSKMTPSNPETPKKPTEGVPAGPQLGPLGGYGMYSMYPNMAPFGYPPDHPASKGIAPQQSVGPGPQQRPDIKEPPLDLISKPLPSQSSEPQAQSSNKDAPPPPNIPASQSKALPQHFYPYNSYIPNMPPYSFNMESPYGPVPMMTEADKMRAEMSGGGGGGPPPQIKEERNKESPSPNDHPKISVQGKPIKQEPISHKEKTESGSSHPMHQMFPRHGPPPHLNRDDDLRRYYGAFSDQRRPTGHPGGMPPTNLSGKDDSSSSSSSQSPHQSSGSGQSGSQSLQSMQQQKKMMSQSPHQSKPSNLSSKDGPKQEDKEPPKIKQEGQKPTMETQGPPPPPTSQYFLHPSYASPFSFEQHPLYRNMLMGASPFNASPYHPMAQMARIPPPEDLSRNPNTKALDLLQHHASQYFNAQQQHAHKIHELSERAMKSPNNNVKASGSSPNVSQPGGPPDRGERGDRPGPMAPGPGPVMQGGMGPGSLGPPQGQPPKNLDKPLGDGPGGKDGPSGSEMKDGIGGPGRSPPPQRHVHTHHHTHVGLGYPLGYPAPYGAAAVLASQQAAAVAVINPYPPGPPK